MLDPRKALIAIDSNVLDKNGTERDQLLDRFVSLIESASICVIVTNSVKQEILNAQTPESIKNAYLALANTDSALSKEYDEKYHSVSAVISGKSLRYKHETDAVIICEAAKQACHYFITEDRRILSKDLELRVIFPNLDIRNLIGFLKLYDRFLNQ